MKYESCQEIVKGKDYTRDEPLCDNTTLLPAAGPSQQQISRAGEGGKGRESSVSANAKHPDIANKATGVSVRN